MILKRIRVSALVLLLTGSVAGVAQNPTENSTPVPTAVQPSDNGAPAPQTPKDESAPKTAGSSTAGSPTKEPDRSAAYYHFMMAHMYEEMVSMYGRSDYA